MPVIHANILALSLTNEGYSYSWNVSCALNFISTF